MPEQQVNTTQASTYMEEKDHLVFTVTTECENGSYSANSNASPHKQGISEASTSPGSASNLTGATSQRLSIKYNESRPPHSIVVSLPDSPAGTRRVVFSQMHETFINGKSNKWSSSSLVPTAEQQEEQKLHPQASMTTNVSESKISFDGVDHLQPAVLLRNDSLKVDKRFDSFKTWSGRLERQLSNLRGRPVETTCDVTGDSSPSNEIEAVPVDRFFDALEGPELDTLKASEELALPQHEQWPFLLRFPISSFGICLGVGSQAILWRTLATTPSVHFLHVKPTVNFVLWCTAVTLLVTISAIYLLKIIFYLEAVKREYYHPVRVNFFFAPWIACLFLALGLPPSIAVKLPAPLWYILMAPILCLELKIYGQWMSGGQRRLSKVANPSNHLSIVGNFVGALLGASMGIKEGPIFFFAVGLAHYIVLFVTLYQRLPTNETLPKELHPVFFLFVAAPSVACTAWAKINGVFDHGARIAYFISIFLYLSLVVRVNFFRGFRFSLAWWAYTFPMTGAAIATIRYANERVSLFTQSLSVVLAAVSTLTVIALLCTTMLHAFIFRDLFPNDISIAITHKKKKSSKKRSNHKSSPVSDGNKESLYSQESV